MHTEDISSIRPDSNTITDADRTRIRELIAGFMSAEFATAGNGKPSTVPLTPFYDPDRKTIIVSSPVAFSGKVRTIANDPRVGLLLHDETGEYLVTGTARVLGDDPAANADYIKRLSALEPDTPKRRANDEKFAFADTRLGRVLVGWVSLRIAVEIEPRSFERVADPQQRTTVPAWPDAEVAGAEAERYDRAVLTTVDDAGYPVIRPLSSIEVTTDGAILEPNPPVTDGQPTCLLVHWHDEASVKLGQRVIRGRVRLDGDSPRFVPASTSTLRNDGLIDTTRFVIQAWRKTRGYMADREQRVTPPGPDGPPVIANSLQFVRDPIGFYRALPGYGDLIRYRIGWNTWTAVVHPDAIERVLVSESQHYRRYNFEELGFDFVTEGLFFTDGEQWRRQRKAIQPAFAPRSLAAFGPTIVAETTTMIDEWDDGTSIDAGDTYSSFVLGILATTLFDLDLDDRREIVTDAGHALADRVDTSSLSVFIPSWIPTRRNRRFASRMARFDELVHTLIEERRADDEPRDDLLSTLLALSDDEDADYSFTDQELSDQLVTFLFAGHETTALVLTFASLAMARDDEVRERLEAEISAVCGDRAPTVDDVADLAYTNRFIRETMRAYPPVYVLFREAREDVTIDGYRIPEGSKLALPQFVVHADERWWEDPETFDPDRWTEKLEDELPEYAYFPFGGGPRHCVGMRFAMLFLTLALATIVQQVRFEVVSDPISDLRLAATLAPADPVELRVHKRG